MKKILSVLSILMCFPALALVSPLERYWTIADKLSTERMITRFDHGFNLDVGVMASKNIRDIIKEGEDAAKTPGTNTDKQVAVEAFLNKYNKREVTANGTVDLSIPLFRFHLFNSQITPDVRGHFDTGALLSLNNLGAGVTTFQHPQLGTVTLPLANTPFVQGYAVETVKAGVNFGVKPDDSKFFGNVHIYYMQRFDRVEVIDRDVIISQTKVIDLDKNKNTTSSITSDMTLGYEFVKNLKASIGMEEIRLAKLSDKESTFGKLYVDDKALYRAHVSYDLDSKILKLTPFAGLHYRNLYDMQDGYYAGLNAQAKLWVLGASALTMVDNNFFTLSPRLKIWFLNFDYALKVPVKSEIDDVKLKPIHSFNLSISIPFGKQG